MAAITSVNPSLVTPVGEARIRRGYATVAIGKGQGVAISGAPPSARYESAVGLAANVGVLIGIALKDAAVGSVCEFVVDGEVGGYAGLTPGARLTVVNGVIDNGAPAAGVASRLLAYNATTVMLV